VYGAATDWVPRGHRAESRVAGHALGGSMYSRADATHAFAELTDALVCESSLRHKADV